MKPIASVVTPSYNHAQFLPLRVASILNQTLEDFEWIIIDDCSTDGSQEVLRELVGHDPRVTLLLHSICEQTKPEYTPVQYDCLQIE